MHVSYAFIAVPTMLSVIYKMDGAVPSSSKRPVNDTHISETAATNSDQRRKDEDSAMKAKPSRKRKRSKKKLKKAILKYEKRMKSLHEQIQKFQEADLSLEEMDEEGSVYVRTDYLMQRLVRTWEEWCHVTGNSPQIVVSTVDAKAYAGTEFEELNKKVQKLLEGEEFPDYQDVRELVEHCNSKHSLGLSKEKEQEVSRAVFKDVGKLMKKKRRQDFLNHFGCHLTDAVHLTNDPALVDKELSSTLAGIDSEAQTQMEQIMEEFVSRQNTRQQSSSSSEGEGEEEEDGESGQGSAKGPATLEEAEDSTSGKNGGESANEETEENPSDQEEEEEEEEEEEADTRTVSDEEGPDVNGKVPSEDAAVKVASLPSTCPSSPEFIEHTGLRDSPPEGVLTVGEPPTESKCIIIDAILHIDRAEGSPISKRRKLESASIIVLDDEDEDA